ncbi:SDR family oxidoreductase [Nocardia sp. GAS34]|uniref:SDR family oxidoreductase n=1 Tax=unclassified Nocardia TaxID=2637762 RepID=UPI003D1C7561
MLTRHLATEVGPHGIRINCIAPSAIGTERILANMPADIQDRVAAQHPLGTPDDVARTAFFLASCLPVSWVSTRAR